MRNSFGSLLVAAVIAFGLAVGAPTSANAESVMQACASQWKQAQTTGATGGQSWPQFLAQCRTGQSSSASTLCAGARAAQSGSLFPWSQPSAPASATASNVGRRPKRHETMREPMERRQGGGNDWRPELATVSGAMPYAPRLRRRALGGGCAGAGPSPSARLSVGLSVPMVAAVGSIFLIGRDRCSASRRIHDRTRGACAVSVGHNRMGQYADAHLSLLGNPVFRAHPQRCVYVRG